MATVNRQSVTGLRELGRALAGIRVEVQTKIARRATNAGAQVVRTAVKAKANQQPTLADKPFRLKDGRIVPPGEIARNTVVSRVKDPEVTSEHVVAVLSNSKNGFIGRVAALNEFGTVEMSPQPFMGPGFEQSKQQALGAIVKTLSNGIDAAAKKAPK